MATGANFDELQHEKHTAVRLKGSAEYKKIYYQVALMLDTSHDSLLSFQNPIFLSLRLFEAVW